MSRLRLVRSDGNNLFAGLRRLFGGPKPTATRPPYRHDAPRTVAGAWEMPAEPELPPLAALDQAIAVPAAENNAFALALYEQLSPAPGNLVFSPLSIHTALAMTYAGARGETAAQMRLALKICSPEESFHAKFGGILQRLGAARQGSRELAVANSVWIREGVTLLPEYVEQVTRCYGSELHPCDFMEPSAARAQMNRWVEEQTWNRIKDLIPHDCPDALTQLILINAVYFKALWAKPFDKEKSFDAPFWLEGGSSVTVPMMRARVNAACAQGPGFRFVNLIYKGGQMSMLVLLPDSRQGLRNLERSLSTTLLHSCLQVTRTVDVGLYLPRFRMSPDRVELRDALKALGMVTVFDPDEADFSGINGCRTSDDEALHVSRVLHKAFLDVNEEGTEAAAASVVEMRCAGLPPPTPVFRADHPFIFAICDRTSGAMVFLGRVLDPTRPT